MVQSDANEYGMTEAPVRIGRRDPSLLVLEWPDGTRDELTPQAVRRACGCAHCVDEHTGRPLLDPASVPEDLTHVHVELVGRYALSIVFSDGHRTGIYSWGRLRSLGSGRRGA